MQWRRVDVGIEAVTPDANLLEAQNVCFGGKWISILDHELGGSKTYIAPDDTCFSPRPLARPLRH